MLWIQQVALFPPQPGPAVFYNARGVLQSQVVWQKPGGTTAITQLPPARERAQLLWLALLCWQALLNTSTAWDFPPTKETGSV